jgi:TRAP-type C4-dicarboxylate transport system permease small subunit
LSRHVEAGLELETGPDPDTPATGALAPFARALDFLNLCIVRLGSLALLAAAGVLTYSVASRYFFKAATDWQDELAVFCLVGAVFSAGAYVQSQRGHIGIELLAAFLTPAANRVRAIVVDIASFLFCAFFSWKSWTLWHESWVDKQTTSSSWAPPLWIPYFLMAFGMTLLAVQIGLQIATRFQKRAGGP